MRDRLERCAAALAPLVPVAGAPVAAIEPAREFNRDVEAVRAALLEPARDLLARGAALHGLPACLERAVAELAFWRRVLVRVHPEAYPSDEARPEFLIRYLVD